MRVSKTLPALLLACALLPAADETAASISGIVINRTGMPVPDALVVMWPPDSVPVPPGLDWAATMKYRQAHRKTGRTDAVGRFSFTNVPPGTYRYVVEHMEYRGLSSELESGPPHLVLEPGEHLIGFTITLNSGGTITGRVVDPSGEPLSRVRVEVLRPFYQRGRRRFVPSAAGTTDENGEFKIAKILPGGYDVRAGDTTTPIVIAAEQAQHIGDITMVTKPRIHVRGRVIGDRELLTGARVVRMPSEPTERLSWTEGAEIQADGSFEIGSLWTGTFTLAVSRNQPNHILGWTVITAGEEDMRDVLINASAAPLSGAIRIDGDTPLKAGSQPMSLRLTAAEGPSVIDVSATISPEGAFQIPLLAPGKYIANLLQLPPGWYVKSMELDRRDALNNGLDFTIGGSTLDILLSPKAAAISGSVVDKEGNPLKAKVTLVPETVRFGHARLYPATTTAEDGTFQLESITPGRYRIYAWENIPDTAHWDEAYIQPFRANGQLIELAESERLQVKVNRISESTMRQELSRAGL